MADTKEHVLARQTARWHQIQAESKVRFDPVELRGFEHLTPLNQQPELPPYEHGNDKDAMWTLIRNTVIDGVNDDAFAKSSIQVQVLIKNQITALVVMWARSPSEIHNDNHWPWSIFHAPWARVMIKLDAQKVDIVVQDVFPKMVDHDLTEAELFFIHTSPLGWRHLASPAHQKCHADIPECCTLPAKVRAFFKQQWFRNGAPTRQGAHEGGSLNGYRYEIARIGANMVSKSLKLRDLYVIATNTVVDLSLNLINNMTFINSLRYLQHTVPALRCAESLMKPLYKANAFIVPSPNSKPGTAHEFFFDRETTLFPKQLAILSPTMRTAFELLNIGEKDACVRFMRLFLTGIMLHNGALVADELGYPVEPQPKVSTAAASHYQDLAFAWMSQFHAAHIIKENIAEPSRVSERFARHSTWTEPSNECKNNFPTLSHCTKEAMASTNFRCVAQCDELLVQAISELMSETSDHAYEIVLYEDCNMTVSLRHDKKATPRIFVDSTYGHLRNPEGYVQDLDKEGYQTMHCWKDAVDLIKDDSFWKVPDGVIQALQKLLLAYPALSKSTFPAFSMELSPLTFGNQIPDVHLYTARIDEGKSFAEASAQWTPLEIQAASVFRTQSVIDLWRAGNTGKSSHVMFASIFSRAQLDPEHAKSLRYMTRLVRPWISNMKSSAPELDVAEPSTLQWSKGNQMIHISFDCRNNTIKIRISAWNLPKYDWTSPKDGQTWANRTSRPELDFIKNQFPEFYLFSAGTSLRRDVWETVVFDDPHMDHDLLHISYAGAHTEPFYACCVQLLLNSGFLMVSNGHNVE